MSGQVCDTAVYSQYCSYIHNDLRVAMVGPKVDLKYDYTVSKNDLTLLTYIHLLKSASWGLHPATARNSQWKTSFLQGKLWYRVQAGYFWYPG